MVIHPLFIRIPENHFKIPNVTGLSSILTHSLFQFVSNLPALTLTTIHFGIGVRLNHAFQYNYKDKKIINIQSRVFTCVICNDLQS